MPIKGYKFGVQWIALNDEPLEMDVNKIEDFISVQLLADLFGKEPSTVANDVRKYRKKKTI